MAKKKNIKLTEHISYCIIDSTIYLFQNNINLSEDEIEILYKKLTLIIEDNGISYINISASKIEDRKEMYQKLGFSDKKTELILLTVKKLLTSQKNCLPSLRCLL